MPKEKILREFDAYLNGFISADYFRNGIQNNLDLYAKEKLRESNKHLEEVISRRIKKLNYTLAEKQIENKDTKDIEIVIKELENIIKQILDNSEKE